MFKLLRYFSLTALVSLALAATALTALFSRAAEQDLLSSAARANGEHATIFANALSARLGDDVWRYLHDEAPHLNTQQLRAHPMTARMQTALRELATGTSVAKVKLFSLQGLTLYSSEASQIGEDKHNTGLIQRAVRGEFASTISQRQSFMSFTGRIYDRSLVSTYIPVAQPGHREPMAVFELYADLTPLKQALEQAHLRRLAIVVSVLAALFLAQYLIVWRGARIIRRQHEGLEAARLEIERARQSAVQANAAKSRFLANMSHEIRTPMHGVLGMTELLSRTPLDEIQARYTQTIARSGHALLAILNDILDLTKIESGKLQLDSHPLDLREVVAGVCDLMRVSANAKGLELEADLPADLPTLVVGDGLRLQQVLHNLVGNAIKFTRRGTVKIAVRAGESPGDYRFSVTDTGIGIAPDVAARLFAPFEQADSSTSRKFGGTGLGLAISRELVELMGGTMGLTSTPGAGSEFGFTLRLTPTQRAPARLPGHLRMAGHPDRVHDDAVAASPVTTATQASMAYRPDATRRAQGVQVLLVEDDSVNVLYAEAVLKNLGLQLVVANDGAQALEAVRREPFALILMDCNMPGMDGLTATPLIRELEAGLGRGRTPLIAVSASAMQEDRARCLAVGMDDFLAKPFHPDELRRMIRRWCPSARSVAPAH